VASPGRSHQLLCKQGPGREGRTNRSLAPVNRRGLTPSKRRPSGALERLIEHGWANQASAFSSGGSSRPAARRPVGVREVVGPARCRRGPAGIAGSPRPAAPPTRPQRLPQMPMSERVLVDISVPPPTSFPRRERRRGGRSAKPLVLYFEPLCDAIPPLTAAPIRRRALSAGSRTWSGPRRGETSGSPPGSGSPSCPGP